LSQISEHWHTQVSGQGTCMSRTKSMLTCGRSMRAREIHGNSKKIQNKRIQMDVIEHVIEYTSGTGDSCHTLPRHIQRQVGNIPEIEVQNGMEVTEKKYIIVATDGSVVIGVGYHGWVVTTDNKQVPMMGGGVMMGINFS
jgi:malic enzyme